MLVVVFWELFVQFWALQPWIMAVYLQGQSAGGLRGSGGASQWVAVQKVLLSAHNQVQCFALAMLLHLHYFQSLTRLAERVPIF